jgi:hypothetical protein
VSVEDAANIIFSGVIHPSAATKPMIGFGDPLLDGPDEHYARLGEAREGFGALSGTTGRRIACREDHPIGIELEAGDLGGRKITIIRFRCSLRWREDQIRFDRAGELAGQRSIGCQVHDMIGGKCPART